MWLSFYPLGYQHLPPTTWYTTTSNKPSHGCDLDDDRKANLPCTIIAAISISASTPIIQCHHLCRSHKADNRCELSCVILCGFQHHAMITRAHSPLHRAYNWGSKYERKNKTEKSTCFTSVRGRWKMSAVKRSQLYRGNRRTKPACINPTGISSHA